MAAAKPYHHGNLRAELLKAATDVVRTRGLPELSLRAVARQARVSHAAPYHHFQDRAALVAAVAEEGFVRLKASMDQQVRGHTDPKDRLEASGVGYVLFAMRNPTHFRVMFGANAQRGPAQHGLEAAARAAHGVLTELAAQCQAAGLIRGGDPALISLAMWSIIHGLAMLIVDGQVPVRGTGAGAVAQLTAGVKQFLWAGLTPPAPRA